MTRDSREAALVQALRSLRREGANLRATGEAMLSQRVLALAADLDARCRDLQRQSVEAR